MTILKRILFILVALVVIIVGGAYFTPRIVEVSRSETIDATPQQVFPFLVDFRKFNQWSPWYGRDPDIVVEYEGAPHGVGAAMKWDSGQRDVGTGRQEITRAEEFSRVESDLDFGEMGAATAAFTLEAMEAGTKVTWGFTGDMGINPLTRYSGLMMDRWVGADYEAGLAKLKDIVEAEAAIAMPSDEDADETQ